VPQVMPLDPQGMNTLPYERARLRQALKQALAAEQAARAALSAELAKLRGRAGAAEPRRGPPSAGKENVGARG
jgi:hypothetical protein